MNQPKINLSPNRQWIKINFKNKNKDKQISHETQGVKESYYNIISDRKREGREGGRKEEGIISINTLHPTQTPTDVFHRKLIFSLLFQNTPNLHLYSLHRIFTYITSFHLHHNSLECLFLSQCNGKGNWGCWMRNALSKIIKLISRCARTGGWCPAFRPRPCRLECHGGEMHLYTILHGHLPLKRSNQYFEAGGQRTLTPKDKLAGKQFGDRWNNFKNC